MQVLFDLDNTLLRTSLLTRLALLDVAPGLGRLPDELYNLANDMEWGYSFPTLLECLHVPKVERAGHLTRYRRSVKGGAGDCLFPGVLKLLQQTSVHNELSLLTRGVETHQRDKFEALTVLHGLMPEERRHFVPPEGQKSAVILDLLVAHREPMVIVDDNVLELLAIQATLPEFGVTLVRMDWPEREQPPHAADGVLWRVAKSAEELAELLNKMR